MANIDARKLCTGKDGQILIGVNGVNVVLAEVDTFTVQSNFTNTDFNPIGQYLTSAVPTNVSFTLSMTEAVVRDDLIMEPLLEAIKNGGVPVWSFQGAIERYDGQEQRMTFSDAVPDGSIDLMNLTPGEILKRVMNFRLNSVPDYLKAFTA